MTIKPNEDPIASTSSAATPGRPAPNFALKTTPDQVVTLKEFRGRPVVLAFYPADFSPVCGDEMTLFNEVLPEFDRFNAPVLGISVDNVWCHLAFSKDRRLRFPIGVNPGVNGVLTALESLNARNEPYEEIKK